MTERYDCSRVPPAKQPPLEGGRIWIESMTKTLARLDELCTGRPA